MSGVAFRIEAVPPAWTAQQKGLAVIGGKARAFTTKKQKNQEQTFLELLTPFKPKAPIEGPVRLEIIAVWPWRESDRNTKIKREKCGKYGVRPHASRPDFDNWCKSFVDALTTLMFITDDATICDWVLKKRFGEKPGIAVTITQIEDPWK